LRWDSESERKLEIFSLSGTRLYNSEWVNVPPSLWHMEAEAHLRLATGVYLYVLTIRGLDGTVRREVRKLVVNR
jgi:ABC-type ATPase with predicted acetyltransferase domain